MPVSPWVESLVRRHNAHFGASNYETTDSPGRVHREPVSGIEHFLDYISRPEYASANFFGSLLRGGDENPFSEAWEGITGRKRYDFIDLAHEQLGLSDKPFFNVPDLKFVPDVAEQIAESLLSPSGITGVALGMVLDPLSWIAPFKVTKVGELGRLAKGALSEQKELLAKITREATQIQKLHGAEAAQAWVLEQAPRFRALKLPVKDYTTGTAQLVFPAEGYIKGGSKVAKAWVDHFAKTGEIPEDLANTLAEQAGKGQLSLFSVVSPFGQNLIEGPAGLPVAEAATRLAQIARNVPQVKAAMQIFSHFNIPQGFMDSLAEWRARRNVPMSETEKMLRATYKVIDLQGTAPTQRRDAVRTIFRAMDVGGPLRVSEQRLAGAARSGSVTDRMLGTADFIRKTEMEAAGATVPEMGIMRQELGLQPADPLLTRTPIQPGKRTPVEMISQFEPLRTHAEFMGIEILPDSPGTRGTTRIIIDRDARPSAEIIKGQLLEVEQLLASTADTVEQEALHARRLGLQRSLDYALRDPVYQRPWRMLVFGKPGDKTEYWAGRVLATDVPVVVGRSGSLEELMPYVQELTQNKARVNVLQLPKNVEQSYLRRVQSMDMVERMLSERARLASRFEETAKALSPHVNNFDEAHRLATENLDPDLHQLERVDRALERLAMGGIGLGRGRPTKKGNVIPLPKARSILGSIDMGRFAGMPDIIRTVALEMEEILDNMWNVEASRGISRSRVQNYIPRFRAEDWALTPWIRGFGHKGPMIQGKAPFTRHRGFMRDIGALDVNQRMNKEYFLEDLMTAIGMRATSSARAIAYHDFINRTLDMFAIQKVTNARDAQFLKTKYFDSEYSLYYPKGEMTWYPTHIVSDASIYRGKERAAAMGRNRLVELTDDEIKQGFGASWNAPAYLLPREVADHLNRVDQMANSDKGIQVFANMIRQFRGTWSKWTLFFFPGFIARNVVGNIANMAYSGFSNPHLFAVARDIQRGKEEWKAISERGEELTAHKMLQEAVGKGPLDSGWAMSEFFSGTETGAREWNLVKRFQNASVTGKRKLLDEMKEPAIMRMGMRVNGWMENNAKLALYIDRRMKGDTADQAAATVRKYLFDYDELRPAERTLKNYVLPYYVWTRKNIPLQFEMAARRPAVFANLSRAQRLLEASSDPGIETLPQWMHEALPVRLKESEEGGSYEYLTLRGWLPPAELETAFSPLHSVMGMLGPWWRIPIERKANYSFWFRRPIEQPKGQKGYFLGQSLARSDIELLSTVRLLSEIDRLMPAPASSPLAGFQAPLWDRLLGSSLTGIGLKTYQVNMMRQRQIAKAQQDRILRELKISLSRAKKRRDFENAALLQEMIQNEERRDPNVVLPLSITGLPTEP